MNDPKDIPIETFDWYRKKNQDEDEVESGMQAMEDFEEKLIEWEENKYYEY